MKQKIDAYALFELSDESIKNLANILKRKVTLEDIKEGREHYARYRKTKGYTLQIEGICDRCTIGSMFEIIDKNWFIELNPPGMDSQYNFELKIIKRKDCKNEDDYVYEEVYNADELCDVLFKAITDQYLL